MDSIRTGDGLTMGGRVGASGVTVLGVDPGLASVGWGVIRWVSEGARVVHLGHGVLKTKAADSTVSRVSYLARELDGLLTRWNPDELASEAYRNYGRVLWNGVQTLYTIGSLVTLGVLRGREVHEYGAKDTKRAIGVTDGEKRSVQARVSELLKLTNPLRNEHAADALCVALAHLGHMRGVPFALVGAAPANDDATGAPGVLNVPPRAGKTARGASKRARASKSSASKSA